MNKRALRMVAISALGAHPDFSKLHMLKTCGKKDVEKFLRWLDHSGLTLYFLSRVKDCGEMEHMSPDLREAFDRRFRSNCHRVEKMLCEFRKVNEALKKRGVPHAFLKGFTLTPEFCADPCLRHQSDIDILVHSASTQEAIQVLIDCDYFREHSGTSGEIRFTTPLTHVPSRHDDIYSTSPHREVELHTSIWEKTARVPLNAPNDCLEKARGRRLRDIEFFSLSSEDMFLMQILHAFSHLLGSWVRVSWLWEIHYYLEKHADEIKLWQAIQKRAGDDLTFRKATGFVLGLTKELFGTSIPEPLNVWCVQTLPERAEAWIRHFGVRWALSDLEGSKLTLFIHREFVEDAGEWKAYLLRRVLPFSGRPSIGRIEASDVKIRLWGRASQLKFTGQRLVFHSSALLTLAWEALQWRRALQSSRKRRMALP
jgi:Uncharacterised nucleotidyltransferase